MAFIRRLEALSTIVVVLMLLVVGCLTYKRWAASTTTSSLAASDEGTPDSVSFANKVIVGRQAQKNLNLAAKSVKVDVFWKTISVPGMVVDRPGVSDREVVAPAAGVVTKIHHVPGDTVQPGDALFTLTLSSDALHETQSGLFKRSQEIKLAQARLERMVAAGEGIARAKIVEVESEIKRLEMSVKTDRDYLLHRGLSVGNLDEIAGGKLMSEITVVTPQMMSATPTAAQTANLATPAGFEVEKLKVEVGQHAEAGEALCLLANHQVLAVEGRAFRDETPFLERSIQEGWPAEVDFQETLEGDWPLLAQSFHVEHIANTIDPVTRTFAFLMPLENQSKTIDQGNRKQSLWRFRPGQKVRVKLRVAKLENVVVLSADAVVREGADAFVFTQNVNAFERKSIHVLDQDREHVVIANDGSLPTYSKNQEDWTLDAVVQRAAAQLNRMTKAGATNVPKGYHIHADGSLHKNEDEGK